MLRNAPIRLKLAVVLLIPVVAILVLAAVRTAANISTSREADQVATRTEFALAGTELAHELQRERGLSVRVLDAGLQPDNGDLRAQRDVVARALAEWQDRAAGLGGGLEPAARAHLDAAGGRLGGLGQLRQDVDTRRVDVDPAVEAYTGMIAELLNTNRRMLLGVGDPQLAEAANAFVALSRVKELTSLQREQITHAALTGQRLSGDRYEAFTSQVANAEVLLAEFRGTSSPAQEQLFVNTLVGPEVQRARELRSVALDANGGQRLDIDPDEWWSVVSYELDLLRSVEQRLGADALDRAGAIRGDAVSSSIAEGAGILAVLLLSVGLSLYVVRLLVGPLRVLRTSAERVAQEQLPSIVLRLQRAEPIDLEAETAPVQVRSRDEVGQVAWAFNSVHSVAVRVAAEQAALRAGVGRLFLNLGHRIQGLVAGQLEMLDELERSELDPEQLRSLFRLDHMATRMRRNAENLLVLAGADSSRRWDEPVALAGMLRAATAEIEDYTRVSLLPMGDVRVAGQAVNDVVHLLAELLENATRFSPAGTQVQVSGEAAPRGFMLEIEDQGVGMTDRELAEVNQRLADPPVVDLIAEHRLGVFVVGRLAARHGIRVRLRRSWFGGVTALVLLPNGLIVGDDAERPAPPKALDLARDLPALTRPGRGNGATRHADVAGRYARLAPPLDQRPGQEPAEPSWALGAGPPGTHAGPPGIGSPGIGSPGPEALPPRRQAPWRGPRHAPPDPAAGLGGGLAAGPAAGPGRGGEETTIRLPQPPRSPSGLPQRVPGATSGLPSRSPAQPEPLPRAAAGPPTGPPLPRRVRGANLAPGIAAERAREGEAAGPLAGQGPGPDVRRALSAFQSAVARGRNDAITQNRHPRHEGEDRGPAE